jgi:hypothetical protein
VHRLLCEKSSHLGGELGRADAVPVVADAVDEEALALGERRESALKKWATWRPSGCQLRTSRPLRSKRRSRRTISMGDGWFGCDIIDPS